MAFRHGKNGSILVNSVDISTFCDSLDFTVNVATADTSTFGSTWTSAIAGLASGTLSFGGDYDGTVTTGPGSALLLCIAGGIPVAFVHKPGGTLAGQRTNSGNALVTSYSESSPVGGVITFKGTLLPTGAITSVTQ